MSSEQTIFSEALAKPSSQERSQFLKQACGGSAELRARVEELLAAHERAGAFLESPPTGVAAGDAERHGVAARLEGPGSVVGRYKLLEQIGEGGMGTVFMAEQTDPVRRRVALKIVKPGLDTKQVIARFEAERQALALMDHPNIAKVFDAGATDAGRPYFVMELVRGIPVTDYCDQQQMPPRQRLELFVQVCQAVQHAHQKGIIHRDIKPNNVLVTVADDGRAVPKIIDFGIAKATTVGQRLTEQTLFTHFQQMVGTPLYMSPEQAEMRAVTDVDTRSDVYSLGVLLYELLTGTTPFDKQRLAKAAYDEVRRILREEEPPRPSTRLSTLGNTLSTVSAQRRTEPKRLGQVVRGELDWIVMRALEKDRGRRYETANGLARDVERYLADQPVEACPPSRTYRMRKLVHRNKAAVATAAIIAAVLVLATGVSAWQALRATRAERKAVLAEHHATSERDRAKAAHDEATRERDQAVTQKQRADEQAEIARAVSEFLNRDVLGQKDVYNHDPTIDAANPNLTVREALDRAAERIQDRFRGQPLIEAEIRGAIGSAYAHVQEFEKAKVHLDAERVLQNQVLGEKHWDNFENLADRVVLELERANPIIAQGFAVRALQVARDLSGERDPRALTVQSLLGNSLTRQGKSEEAEQLLTQTIAAMREVLGPEHVTTRRAMRFLAATFERRGEVDRAETIARDNVQALRSSVGLRHQQTLLAMEDLARILQKQGKLEAAGRVLEEALQHWAYVAGPRFGASLRATNVLCEIYCQQRQYTKLIDTLNRLLKAYPNDHAVLYRLAAAQLYLGQEEAYRNTCRDLLQRFAGSTDAGIVTRTARACLLAPNSVDDFAEVMRLADLSANPNYAATFRLTKGMAEYRAGRYEPAAKWLSSSCRAFEGLLRENDPKGLNPGRYSCLHATAALYLAVAEHRQGHTDIAAQRIASARILFEKVADGVGTSVGAVGGVDWFIAHIAAREAEAFLGKVYPATAPTTAPAATQSAARLP